MAGKSLRQADREHEHEMRKASEDKDRHADQRREASEAWRSLVGAVAKESDVGIFGYTDEEVSRARREISLGKGLHEEPYIGLDEYEDPLAGGYETDVDPDDFEYGDQTEVAPDALNSMDRFRSKGKRRSRRGGDVWEEGEG